MMNFEQAKQVWENEFNAGTIEERILRSTKVASYFNHLASKKDAENRPLREDAYAQALIQNCGLNAESTVLDVGCGGGDGSWTFAKQCKHVTAIDMCSEMLRLAQRHADGLTLRNISFTQSLWEDFDTTDRFDLCYSAMCGGICNYDELTRFESYSRKSCAIVTIGYREKKSARTLLREAISKTPLPGLLVEGVYLFDLLYAMGRHPNVIETRNHFFSRLPVDEAIERLGLYYGAYGYDDANSQKKIREHIKSHAENGWWIESDIGSTMLIYWQVPGNGS
jgi:SAM-dependent methyltransferase